MSNLKELIKQIPCDTCAHKTVCATRKQFLETTVNTTHPYIKVTLGCTEYMQEVIATRKTPGWGDNL